MERAVRCRRRWRYGFSITVGETVNEGEGMAFGGVGAGGHAGSGEGHWSGTSFPRVVVVYCLQTVVRKDKWNKAYPAHRATE